MFMSCTLRSLGHLAGLRPTPYHLSLSMESLKSRFTLAVVAIVLSMSGCFSNESVAPEPTEATADPAFFLSSFQVADPRAEGQLVDGFLRSSKVLGAGPTGFSLSLETPPPRETFSSNSNSPSFRNPKTDLGR